MKCVKFIDDMGEHNDFGKLGEEKAMNFLTKNGYIIKSKNYRYLKAEIDIIAQKENVLAIVEVKSRSSMFIEHIAQTVNQKKINLLVAAANNYIVENDIDVDVRFDIITVLKKGKVFKLEHLKNAFYHF